MKFCLTSKSLKNIKEAGFDDDFEIIILDEKIICSKFLACFLSPKISRALRSDFTLDHYYFDIPSESVYYKNHDELKKKLSRTNFITKLNNILEGETIEINDDEKEQKEEIIELFYEFGNFFDNEEMIEEIIEEEKNKMNNTEINQKNIQEILEKSRRHKKASIKKKALEFIASHFYSILNELDINDIESEELEYILSSSELRIESEDWLFERIEERKGDSYLFIDYINVEYLTNEKMQEVVDKIDNYEVSLHRRLWLSICRRLVSEGMKPKIEENPRQNKNCNKNKNNKNKDNNEGVIESPTGIIENIRKESRVNNNPYESKLIDVETSQINDGEIKDLFDKSKDTHFRLSNQPNGFILLDFKDKRIKFSKYYFSVPNQKAGYSTGRPKSWLIEGSNDKQTWFNIDKKENDSSLNDYGRSNTFTCQNINKEFYRFIRIKEIISHCGSSETHYFMLSELEFYGQIKQQ